MKRFKGLVIEFLTEGFDRLKGLEILFTPDYLGFYKGTREQTKYFATSKHSTNGKETKTQADEPDQDSR
jgi:hypothetical protein